MIDSGTTYRGRIASEIHPPTPPNPVRFEVVCGPIDHDFRQATGFYEGTLYCSRCGTTKSLDQPLTTAE